MNNTAESIYENICKAKNELDMLPQGYSLPPEPSSQSDNFRFADGALDGIAIYHMGIPPQDASLLEQALDAAATDLDQAHKLVSAWTSEGHVISVMNQVRQYVTDHQQRLSPSSVYRLAAECALKGTHREEVKFGLILLELVETDQNEQLKHALRILALSDEFVMYILPIAAQWTFAEKEILRIARKVRGWGRIHAVTWLKAETPECRDWLFEEGWDNIISPAYSALECYHKGNMRRRLENGPTAREFASACGLMTALLDEGPMAGISEVKDSDGLLRTFLDCAAVKAVSPERQKALKRIAEYAEEHQMEEIRQSAALL